MSGSGGVSRRVTLEWMAAMSVASAIPRVSWADTENASAPHPASKGYGTDPNLKEPVVPWPLVMEAPQLQLGAALADLILPGSAQAPAPSALGVADYVNEWVSAPYPEQVADRVTVFEGLRWLDAESARRGGRNFLRGDEHTRQAIVADIAQKEPRSGFAAQKVFFQRFQFLVVSAYYTTSEGLGEIGYTGNIPLPAYPPITAAERAVLEAALSRLGLS